MLNDIVRLVLARVRTHLAWTEICMHRVVQLIFLVDDAFVQLGMDVDLGIRWQFDGLGVRSEWLEEEIRRDPTLGRYWNRDYYDHPVEIIKIPPTPLADGSNMDLANAISVAIEPAIDASFETLISEVMKTYSMLEARRLGRTNVTIRELLKEQVRAAV